MRILMLAQFFPPIIGGEERHVYNLSRELVARGHHVAVATIQHGKEPEFTIEEEGVGIYRVLSTTKRLLSLLGEKERYHAPPFPDPEILRALRDVICQESPDIIHAHNWMVHSFTLIKDWSRARLIVTLHDYSRVCVTKRLMRHGQVCQEESLLHCLQCANEHYGIKGTVIALTHRLSRELERRTVDMFLPVSQAVAEGTQLVAQNLPYRVIPNFVPSDLVAECDSTSRLLRKLPPGDFLLFVGDIVADKGIDVLLRAYDQLHSGIPFDGGIPLVLIGRTTKKSPTRFPFNTYVFEDWPHEAVLAAWERCTLAIVPSVWPDPCPTVAIEAMAMGKPVIGSRIGGLIDIVIDNETGLLVRPGDVQALKSAIQDLLQDPQRREQMGNTARQRVSTLEAQAVVTKIERVYEEVLQA